jgi:hypothetical protein
MCTPYNSKPVDTYIEHGIHPFCTLYQASVPSCDTSGHHGEAYTFPSSIVGLQESIQSTAVSSLSYLLLGLCV